MADELIHVELSSSQISNMRALHMWLEGRAGLPAWVALVIEDLDRTCRIAKHKHDDINLDRANAHHDNDSDNDPAANDSTSATSDDYADDCYVASDDSFTDAGWHE